VRQKRVGSNDLKPGPIRRESLPASLIARIEALHSTLQGVYPQSMAEWLDGFQRDAHPQEDLLWWERLARCYVDYSSRNKLDREQSQDAFNVICRMAMGASAVDLRADLAHLPRNAVDEILAIMRTVADIN
jgi:hypothetical protein